MFFLSFDQFGTNTHTHVEPPANSIAAADLPAVPDVGVKTFAQLNATLSSITGVSSTTDQVVNTAYNSLQQSLPPAPDLTAFVASQQTAVAQLSSAYCTEMTNSATLRAAFFPGLDFTQSNAATYFGASGSANRGFLITPLVAKAVGVNVGVNVSATNPVSTELDNLITALVSINGNSSGRVTAIAQDACSAALGSSVVSIQ
jgi:hypothetical protein